VQTIDERIVFFISDNTGITAETLGHTLLSQFQGLEYKQFTIPFVNTLEKAETTVNQINQMAADFKTKPLIFTSIVNPDIERMISTCNGKCFDMFKTFIPKMENELGIQSSKLVGHTHSMKNIQSYNSRIEAVNYALNCDDGVGLQNYSNAELILIGVSRCGKTPTSIYLALHYGLFIANYPLTEEDFPLTRLPRALQPHKDKLFGLTIHPQRLQHIRHQRRRNSHYASIDQCQFEIIEIEKLFLRESITFVNTTNQSIEEISASILDKTALRRKSY